MKNVFIVHAYEAKNWDSHTWLDKVFSTKKLAKDYISQKIGFEIEENKIDLYENSKSEYGYIIKEYPIDSFED